MTGPEHPAAPPTDERADPPPPGSAWVEDHVPSTEAEREAAETVRSISRLEESN
jgi:hypothetical protein